MQLATQLEPPDVTIRELAAPRAPLVDNAARSLRWRRTIVFRTDDNDDNDDDDDGEFDDDAAGKRSTARHSQKHGVDGKRPHNQHAIDLAAATASDDAPLSAATGAAD